jgi:hypothetical protein
VREPAPFLARRSRVHGVSTGEIVNICSGMVDTLFCHLKPRFGGRWPLIGTAASLAAAFSPGMREPDLTRRKAR